MLPYTFSKKHDNALLVLLGWSDFQMRSKQEPGLTILGGYPPPPPPLLPTQLSLPAQKDSQLS